MRREDGSQDHVLLIRVFYSPKRVVRTNKREAWIRLGDRKKQLKDEEIRELEIDRGQVDFELDFTDYQYPDEFRRDLIQQYANNFRKVREGRMRTDISDEEILELQHLGKVRKRNIPPKRRLRSNVCKRPSA